MDAIDSVNRLRQVLAPWRRAGERIALVPTMGNLHEGHLRLVEEARTVAERVVVSVFVNPTQFCPGEDFASYPRTLAEDSAKLAEHRVDVLFAPAESEVYPRGRARTVVELPDWSRELCGEFRPGHFRGVTTVVCKLLNMVQPDIAVFGEKDFQQLAIIRAMVEDLNFPVAIVGVPTVREHDGLAMSSRNAYLSPEQRPLAAMLYRSLLAAGDALVAGSADSRQIESAQLSHLRQQGFDPDYFSIRRCDDLKPALAGDRELVILVAARLGRTRLIDNLRLTLS